MAIYLGSDMNTGNLGGAAALMFGAALMIWAAGPAAAKDKSPAWFLQPGMASTNTGPAPAGPRRNPLADCADDIAKLCTGLNGAGANSCLRANSDRLGGTCKTAIAAVGPSMVQGLPTCVNSPVCDPSGPRGDRTKLMRVEWKQTMGYKFAYPYEIPAGGQGILGVGIDSKGNMWAYQRSPAGHPALFKFGPDRKLLLSIGDDVLGHLEKAHGMALDAGDNVWICDSNTSVVMKISPEGKLLLTLGTSHHGGDWDESRNQHLIWQPMDIAFAPNGDFFIAEGHANESPNDVDSPDPTNNQGAARILHFDKNAHFVNQWFGNSVGQGRFSMAHGVAVDPKTGYVWIGDREQYRLVVYKPDGEFVKTIQMRNLTCAIAFDKQGQMWVASGMDGQILKVDQADGAVLGAIGNGQGIGEGQFTESNYLTWDKEGNLYTGDTLVPRITEMVKPKKLSMK